MGPQHKMGFPTVEVKNAAEFVEKEERKKRRKKKSTEWKVSQEKEMALKLTEV